MSTPTHPAFRILHSRRLRHTMAGHASRFMFHVSRFRPHVSRFRPHVSRLTPHVPLLAACLWLLGNSPAPARIPFALEAGTWPEPQALNLVIPDNGLLPLQLVRTNSTAWTNLLEFKLFAFRDVVTGDPLLVRMFIEGQGSPSNAVDQLAFRFQADQALLELTLVVPPPPSTNAFLGSLGIRESDGIWTLHKLGLHRVGAQKLATLVVDQPALNVTLTRTARGAGSPPKPNVTVTLHDESRTWPIQGITLTPRSLTSPARTRFSFDQNVVCFLNGVVETNLARSPSDSKETRQRSIAAGGQAVLGLGFVGLEPGEYTLDLKLLALNSRDDDKQQRLTINIKVSDSVLPALGALVLAALVSFLGFKWLRFYRQRLDLQRRLDALQQPWLKEYDPIFSVVWVRTVLCQTEKLIGKLLLVTPELITARLDKVTPVIEALGEAHRVRLNLRALPQLVSNRFDGVVAAQLRAISDQDMDAAVAQKARDTLRALGADLAVGRIEDSYWAEVHKEIVAFFLGKDVASFRARLQAGGMTAAALAKVDALLSTRQDPPKPADLEAMMVYEATYVKIKLLFQRQQQPVFAALVAAFEEDFEKAFQLVNQADWDRIKNATLQVKGPVNNGTHEAYQPIRFSVTTGDQQLDETYLFRRGLKFRWHFNLQEDEPRLFGLRWSLKWLRDLRQWVLAPQKLAPPPATLSPRIVYFSVAPGNLSVSAGVLRPLPAGDEQGPVSPAAGPVSFGKSSEFSFFQHWEWAEGLSLLLAALFAIISGLLTFYYKNPTFGSYQDYLTLFLWGVGVDQTKNFLQVMQSSKPEPLP